MELQNRLINGETLGDTTMRATIEKVISVFGSDERPNYIV